MTASIIAGQGGGKCVEVINVEGSPYTLSISEGGVAVSVKSDLAKVENAWISIPFEENFAERYPVVELVLSDISSPIDIGLRVVGGDGKAVDQFEFRVRPSFRQQRLLFDCSQQVAASPQGFELKITTPLSEDQNPSLNIVSLSFAGESYRAALLGRLKEATTAARSYLDSKDEPRHSKRIVRKLQRAVEDAQKLLDSTVGEFAPKEARRIIDEVYGALTLYESKVSGQSLYPLVDDGVTQETKNLYANLMSLAGTRMLYGMHDALGYGVGWENDDQRSDIEEVCGDLPVVFGWDVIEVLNYNSADSLRERMERVYRMGGINTFCWHAYDPLRNGFYSGDILEGDYSGSVVASLISGGEHHEHYKESLEHLAMFLKSLRGESGESVPVIFRPFHEHNGSWFWWGKDHCSERDFIKLWRFTVEYLRDELGVRNLLYAFSPDAGQYDGKEEFFERYPGDEYVDIFGIDGYWMKTPTVDKPYFVEKLRGLVANAKERGKVAALTETGDKFDYENGGERLANEKWFTEGLLASVLEDSDTKGVAYAMTWRNDNPKHHFNPYPGHPSVPDFLEFYEHPYTVFLGDGMKLYDSQVAP